MTPGPPARSRRSLCARVPYRLHSDNVPDSVLHETTLLAGVDAESGEVTHVISLGDYEYDSIEQHPMAKRVIRLELCSIITHQDL